MQPDRLDAIRRHLYANGASSIQDLANAVGASVATVRRDLHVLERQGVIDRTHGGAQIAKSAEVEVAFDIREKQHLSEKRAIGAAAYDLLEPHSSIFLDAGTTVLQLVRCLRVHPLPLTIFTNGLIVAQELVNVPKVKVTVIGGQVRNENASLVGPAAEAALDQLFLGAGAIGVDHRIYSLDPHEASINHRMQKRAARTIVMADASKFGRCSTHVVSELVANMRIISDDGLSPACQTALRDKGLLLTVVPAFAPPKNGVTRPCSRSP